MSLRTLEADTSSPEGDLSMGKDSGVGCLALGVAQQRLYLGVLFKLWNCESHRERPEATQVICIRAGMRTRSLLPTPRGHSRHVVPTTLLSWCPLRSLQGSSRAPISAARNTTAAHRLSHPSSTTMASETTDSTPSPTATVMPGWWWAGRAGNLVWDYPLGLPGAESEIPENPKGSASRSPLCSGKAEA